MAIALEYQGAQRAADAGQFTETQARKVIKGIMDRTGSVLRCPSIEEWLNKWSAGRTADTDTAEGTSTRYAHVVESFITHLQDRAKGPLSALSKVDLQGFYVARIADGKSPTTARLDTKTLGIALQIARNDGLIDVNPARQVKFLKKSKSITRGTYNANEVKILVAAAEGEWKTMILLAYFTGARISDCAQMAWSGDGDHDTDDQKEGVDLAAGTITFWQQKTSSLITVPLHRDLLAHLEKLASSDSPQKFLMPGIAATAQSGRRGLSETFKNLVRQAGLDIQSVKGGGDRMVSRRSFHALRHSFVSALANAGVNAEQRKELSGHADDKIHERYTHLDMKLKRKAMEQMPGLAGTKG